MTYDTGAGVEARMAQHGGLSSSTKPTKAQADAIRQGVSAEIDAAMANNGLSVPVSSPPALVSYLAAVEVWGTVAEVLKARFPDSGGPGSEAAWDFFESRYKLAMDRLWSGDALAKLDSAANTPSSYGIEHPTTDSDLGTNAEPTFSTGMKW